MARGIEDRIELSKVQKRSDNSLSTPESRSTSRSITRKLAGAKGKSTLFSRLRRKASTLLAVGTLALTPAALSACATPYEWNNAPIERKTPIEKNLDKVGFQVNEAFTVNLDYQDDTINPIGAKDVPSTKVEFLGENKNNVFEINAFRIKVENPLPDRALPEWVREYVENPDDRPRQAKEDYEYYKAILDTPPPVTVTIGLPDQEYSGRYGKYSTAFNPLFSIDGILQDGTWQSNYLAQPIQFSKGQQYIMEIIYSETSDKEGDGRVVKAEIPVAFD